MTLSKLKKELQKLGLSTTTVGLVGEDRFEELKFRYEEAINKVAPTIQINDKSSSSPPSSSFVVPSMANLSIGELRSRLTDLGENTNTPGINGEERRIELMKRLVGAICGSDDHNDMANNLMDEIAINKPSPRVIGINVFFVSKY
jgi:hypothetical protein